MGSFGALPKSIIGNLKSSGLTPAQCQGTTVLPHIMASLLQTPGVI